MYSLRELTTDKKEKFQEKKIYLLAISVSVFRTLESEYA
jgi:hypothetical protein